jgi:hypothetical protein
MIRKLLILTMLCISLYAAPAGAAFFSLPWGNNNHDSYDSFFNKTVLPLNTQNNIQLATSKMSQYNITAIKVNVIDYKQSFYVVNGIGLSKNIVGSPDKTIKLTSGQIRNLAKILQDGKVTYFESWQLGYYMRGLK